MGKFDHFEKIEVRGLSIPVLGGINIRDLHHMQRIYFPVGEQQALRILGEHCHYHLVCYKIDRDGCVWFVHDANTGEAITTKAGYNLSGFHPQMNFTFEEHELKKGYMGMGKSVTVCFVSP